MYDDQLLNLLYEERIKTALESSLITDLTYQNAVIEADNKLDKLHNLNLNENQRLAIDEAISENNYMGAEYGRVAYQQGFKDALKLVSELSELL
ncbi:hypothetical protein [Anaerosporobacter sp.]